MVKPDDKYTPRLKKMLAAQSKLSFVSAGLAIFCSYEAWPNAGTNALAFFFMLLLMVFLFSFFNYVIFLILRWKIYNNDTDAIIRDSKLATALDEVAPVKLEVPAEVKPVETTHDVEIEIVDMPEEPYGFYQGAIIYEWLVVKWLKEDVVLRVKFKNTVDTSKSKVVDLPEDCLLLPPGIVYEIDHTAIPAQE